MPSEKSPAATDRKSRGQSGKTLGKYRIEKKVGEGGMGAVYRAVDDSLGRVVALKVLPRDKARNEIMVKRFKSEARAAANLKHDNIVGVYDSGEADGFLYIAMEFVDGIDVHDLLLRKGVLSPNRSLDIVKQVTRALQHAYEQNIVHRDIKPSNLMIMRDGSVKLADMGLARSLDDTESSAITRAGTTVGTVDYMSPEQARDSRAADCRSDIYSLAATWFYMLTGQPPFPDGDILNKIAAHAIKPRPNPQTINAEIPDAINDLIQEMMAIEPAERYQTPSSLLEDLETANLSAKAITADLLAALADGDTEVPASRPSNSKPASKSPSRPPPEPRSTRGTGESRRAAEPKRPVGSSSGQTKKVSSGGSRKPGSGPTKKVGRKAKAGNTPRNTPRNASKAETVADEGSTSSIPSSRDAMLGGKRLRKKYREKGGKSGVEFSAGRLIAVVVGIVALIVIGNMVLSSFQGNRADPNPTLAPGADDESAPPASPSSAEDPAPARPRKRDGF